MIWIPVLVVILLITDLSFLGWGLLVVLTFGIGGLWYVHYENITKANIYNQIKGNMTSEKVNEL